MNNLVAYTVELIQNEMKIESGNFKYIVIVQCLELGFFLKKRCTGEGREVYDSTKIKSVGLFQHHCYF